MWTRLYNNNALQDGIMESYQIFNKCVTKMEADMRLYCSSGK